VVGATSDYFSDRTDKSCLLFYFSSWIYNVKVGLSAVFFAVHYVSSRIQYFDYPPILEDEFEALKKTLIKTYGDVL
jgi:hypothetical protein